MAIQDEIELFKQIPEFPDYSVSNFGRVVNMRKPYHPEMTKSPIKTGDLTVGLTYQQVQYRRSVKVLVAEAFVPGRSDICNTPIQLDGDRDNLRADNIVWRPRWFAWKFRRQFETVQDHDWVWAGPIYVKENDDAYENAYHAAISLGVLWNDIWIGMHEVRPVWPVGLTFTYKMPKR